MLPRLLVGFKGPTSKGSEGKKGRGRQKEGGQEEGRIKPEDRGGGGREDRGRELPSVPQFLLEIKF